MRMLILKLTGRLLCPSVDTFVRIVSTAVMFSIGSSMLPVHSTELPCVILKTSSEMTGGL